MTNKKLIEVLNTVNEPHDWITLINDVIDGDNILLYKRNEMPIELLERINFVLKNSKVKLKQYFNALMDVYDKIELINANGEKIYLFHYLFSSIKPIEVSQASLIKQLRNDKLINVFYDKINLHASLIASLRSYGTDKESIKTHLSDTLDKTENPMIFNSSLSYFRKNNRDDDNNFFEVINKVLKREKLSYEFNVLISSNLNKYVLENESGAKNDLVNVFEWYYKCIKSAINDDSENSTILKKPAYLINIDNEIRTWLNYKFDGIKKKPYGMLLMTLVNMDFPLPIKHYQILEETEKKHLNKQKKIVEDVVALQFKLYPEYIELYGLMDSPNFLSIEEESTASNLINRPQNILYGETTKPISVQEYDINASSKFSPVKKLYYEHIYNIKFKKELELVQQYLSVDGEFMKTTNEICPLLELFVEKKPSKMPGPEKNISPVEIPQTA